METEKKLQSYSVGVLENPQDSDDRFDELEDAEVKAIENSVDDGAWGVWDKYTGALVSIAYQMQIYSQ